MCRYTQPPHTHVVLLHNCKKKGLLLRDGAEQTVPTAKNAIFACYCKQVRSGNGIAGNRSKNVAETPEARFKQKAHRGEMGTLLETLKDTARKEIHLKEVTVVRVIRPF